MRRPRHPVYVISKGRANRCLTARFLVADRVPFRLVVEPHEADAYAEEFGRDVLVETPFKNLGQGSIPARNFVWQHAVDRGAHRHWILDDNITYVERFQHGKRTRCVSGPVFALVEDFVDRYDNVGLAGLNYHMFGVPGSSSKPFFLNAHVYSFILVRNDLPFRWRGPYNEDTDLCLQTLALGECTVLVNVFLAFKMPTMRMKGGNTDELYQGDGRLKMARSLERRWPGVVTVRRRYGRPQHVVDWKRFRTPLRYRDGFDPATLPDVDEYGLALVEAKGKS